MAVFPVILDSCVLYPMYLRDTLLCAAEAGLYRGHWSPEILDGALRNLVAKQQITTKQASRLQRQMNLAFPEAMIEVTEHLIPWIAKAGVIVTDNLKHFPASSLSQFRIEAQSADQFLTYLYDLFPESMLKVLKTQVSVLRNPPMSVVDLLNLLKGSVPTFVARFQYRDELE